MPDGRRMFVWLGEPTPQGFYYFDPERGDAARCPEAERHALSAGPAGRFLPRRRGVGPRRARAICSRRFASWRAGGYDYPTLLLSITNEWRIDNDPPFPPLADFVAAWNRLELEAGTCA